MPVYEEHTKHWHKLNDINHLCHALEKTNKFNGTTWHFCYALKLALYSKMQWCNREGISRTERADPELLEYQVISCTTDAVCAEQPGSTAVDGSGEHVTRLFSPSYWPSFETIHTCMSVECLKYSVRRHDVMQCNVMIRRQTLRLWLQAQTALQVWNRRSAQTSAVFPCKSRHTHK